MKLNIPEIGQTFSKWFTIFILFSVFASKLSANGDVGVHLARNKGACVAALKQMMLSNDRLDEIEAFYLDSKNPLELSQSFGSRTIKGSVISMTISSGEIIHLFNDGDMDYFLNSSTRDNWLKVLKPQVKHKFLELYNSNVLGSAQELPTFLVKSVPLIRAQANFNKVGIKLTDGKYVKGYIEYTYLERDKISFRINKQIINLTSIIETHIFTEKSEKVTEPYSPLLSRAGFSKLLHTTEANKLSEIIRANALVTGDKVPVKPTGLGLGANINNKVFVDLHATSNPLLDESFFSSSKQLLVVLVFELTALDVLPFHISSSGWIHRGVYDPFTDLHSYAPHDTSGFFERGAFGEIVFYSDLPLHFLSSILVDAKKHKQLLSDLHSQGIDNINGIPLEKLIKAVETKTAVGL